MFTFAHLCSIVQVLYLNEFSRLCSLVVLFAEYFTHVRMKDEATPLLVNLNGGINLTRFSSLS